MELSVFDTLRRLHAYKQRVSSTPAELFDDVDLNGVITAVEIVSKETNLAADEWTHLFLRRLNRTLTWVEYVCDHRDAQEETTLSSEDPRHAWTSYREDYRCIQEHRSSQEDPVIWSHFRRTVEFENELKRRQEQFEEVHGSRQTIRELCQKHEAFLREYLDSCISFHSTLRVRGLTSENVIHTVRTSYEQDGIISSDLAQSISEKITIPLQSASSHLIIGDLGVLEGESSVKPSRSALIPSGENIFICLNGTIRIRFFLEKYRWSVILGDPGSGKTTLLRCILMQAVRAFSNQGESRRLPILIRIGELITWLEIQPNMPSLLDYIGHHTWFGSFYTPEKHRSVLLEFLSHGHAILLFDGLDEVSDNAQRQKIVSLIEQFTEDHVRTPEQISINDDSEIIASWGGLFCEAPALVQGNQMIVTSRMVGYRLFPLMGNQFVRFIIRELTSEEAKTFVNNWFLEVHYAISQSIEALLPSKPTTKTKDTLAEKVPIIDSFLRSTNENIWSSPVLLALALPFVHRQSAGRTLTSRVSLYEMMVNSALTVSFMLDSTTRLDMQTATCLLYDMAGHLHRYCPSGFVDTFDLTRLLFKSLDTFYRQKKISLASSQLEISVQNFMEKLNANIGFVNALGLDVYGFVHRTFQEYFVAMSIVNPLCNQVHASPIVMSELVFSHVMKQNFREPLALAIGWINSHWSSEDFDLFCISLMEQTIGSIPVGVILLFDVLDEFSNMPSTDLMRRIFDRALSSSPDKFLWNNLRGRLNRSMTAQNCAKTLLQLGIHRERLCQFLFERFDYRNILYGDPNVPIWIAEREFSELLFSDEEDESMETMKDMASRTLALKENFSSNVLADYLLEHNVSISEMHISVLSVIISLCGGIRLVEVIEDEEYSIEFDASDMYRSTPLSEMLIEYFADDQTESSVRLQNLAAKCEEILSSSRKDETSTRVVDTCVALICLRGVGCPTFYERFACHLSLPRALYRLKLVFYHWREHYKSLTKKHDANKDKLSTSGDFLFDSQRPHSVALATAVAYERMTRMSTQRVIPSDYTFHSDRFIRCSTRFLQIFGNLHLSPQADDSERIEEGRHPYQVFHDHPLFLISFLSLRLQLLFERLLLRDHLDKQVDTYENEKVPYIVLLSETLLQLTSFQDDNTRPLLLLEVLGELVHRYRLDSYSHALINLMRREESSLQSVETDVSQLLEHTIEELLEKERIRCSDVQHMSDVKQADLQLFISSISIACLSELTERRKEFFEQAMSSTRAIQDAYLKLLCLRHIREVVCHWLDTTFYDMVQEELVIGMNDLAVDIPILMAALLVAMCMEDGEDFHDSLRRFKDSLWSRVQAVPTNETEARDQEAVYLSLRDVFCFKIPPSFLSRPVLSTVLQMNSPVLTEHFETEEILDESEKVFFAQMYLTELAVDAQLLEVFMPLESKSNRLEISKTQLDRLWVSLSSSYMDFIFPHREITMINLYVQQELPNTIEIPFDKLRSCNGFQPRDRPAIETWLEYKSDKCREHMAFLAVFLLIRQGDMTPAVQINVEEILENSLFSPMDSIRQAAQAAFMSFQRDLIGLKCIAWSQSMWHALRKLYMNVCVEEQDHTAIRFTRFDITSVEALDVLLTLERERIYSDMETNVHDEYRYVSFFLMIDGWSDNIRKDIDTRLRALIGNLTVTVDSLFDEYLSTVLLHIIAKSWNVSLTESLVELLSSLLDRTSFPLVQQAAALILGTRTEGKAMLIRHVATLCDARLTEAISDVDEMAKDQTIVACLKGTVNSTFVSESSLEDFQKLCLRLRSLYDVNSIVARLASACAISIMFINEKDVNNLTTKSGLDVYMLYLFLKIVSICTLDRSGMLNVDSLVSLIDLHCAELMGDFVNDLLDCLCGQSTPRLDVFSSSTKVFLRIACNLLKPKRNELLRAVRASISDEKFQNALYRFYEKAHFNERRLCIQLYSAFDVLTVDFITMVFTLTVGDFNEINAYEGVKNVDDRDCIALIFPYLQSQSMIQRYCAAKWLAHLASNHVVSSKEVELLLGGVSEDPSSQQLLCVENEGLKKSLHSHIQYILLRMTCVDAFSGEDKVLSVEEVEASFLEALTTC